MNLGELSYNYRLHERAEAATGLDRVMKLWGYYNSLYSSLPQWGNYNRHFWRCKAMYFGGDVELGEFPGSLAGQRLHNYRQPPADQPQEFESVCDDSFTGCGKLRRRFESLDRLRASA